MRTFPFLAVLATVVLFFWQFFFKVLLPIPSDTIVGLYHPFRDVYAKEYPRGVPFKNFLITDPVRQQYPWRFLALEQLKKGKLPLWNPYTFSGSPLLANFQTAVFYPFNVLLFIFPFHIAWSLLIFLEPLLAGIFMFLYLDNLKLSRWASLFGSLSFSLSGFSISWLEWGNILHTALWLPLILLSIDKVFCCYTIEGLKTKKHISKIHIKDKKFIFWALVFVLSLTSSFFAGHLQVFFYLFMLSLAYILVRWFQYGRRLNILILFLFFNILFLVLTSIQWIPTLQFISESARKIDQVNWQKESWFIPWQNLAQFFAPDFFGNPATLNYWGVFNYGEFIGYVGVTSLIFIIFALFFRYDRKTLFFGTIFFLSLIFALPTAPAKIPYVLDFPFISSSQPTRLLFITDFSLAVLAGLGFDFFLRRKKGIIFPIISILLIFGLLLGFAKFGNAFLQIPSENFAVAQRNLILPILVLTVSIVIILFASFVKIQKFKNLLYFSLLLVLTFDLLRFGLKFTPFTSAAYLFPESQILHFIQDDKDLFRVMTDDSRILPPNFSVMYKIQSIDGYDPLYLQRYGELMAASARGEPNIAPPFGFNRIITLHNLESKIIDFLGVKYVLSLRELSYPKLEKVFQEGETRLYKNKNAFKRAFFVENVIFAHSKQDSIKKLFDTELNNTAIVEEKIDNKFTKGAVQIIKYEENKIIIETENQGEGFLVLIENFYPTWKAKIDGKNTKIYRTDYNFRGIIVPSGRHMIEFQNYLF